LIPEVVIEPKVFNVPKFADENGEVKVSLEASVNR
jgi:hypothetical protein